MSDIFDKTMIWIKGNVLIVVLIVVVGLFVVFPKALSGLISSPRKRRRRVKPIATGRTRSLPRSVGMRKMKSSVQYNKDGTKKKPWQIKGSPAARRRMAQIRRMR